MYKVNGFNQQKAINLKLGTSDLLILESLIEWVWHDDIVLIEPSNIISDIPILGIKKGSLEKIIRNLCKLKILSCVSDLEKVGILKSKKCDGYGLGSKACSWCGINSTVLESHHYPIMKSKGGTQIVDICSNCHAEFHQNNFYKINNKIIGDLMTFDNESEVS